MIIAIDGPAGSGKSTTARLVAKQLGFLYLDTGAMYRAVGLAALRSGQRLEREVVGRLLPSLHVELAQSGDDLRVHLNGEDVTQAIRRPEVGAVASQVSAWPEVREKLVAEQRRTASEARSGGRGVVLDGRDIGTVVFPDADLKIFMDADAETRARRRHMELQTAGEEVDFESVFQEIIRRDRKDRSRTASPLQKAADAIVIDTSRISIAEQVSFVIDRVRERGSGPAVEKDSV